ncbi:MAG TPA: acyltransferase family protein [Novosphingobium sp.]|nr:acyltransferase family protein [Novosphingobium sp.]
MTSSFTTPAEATATPPRPPRNQAVEALRILSAFGIVEFHGGGALAGYFYTGLIVFIALSPMLDCYYNWERLRPIRSLAKTLLIPWLFWSVIYAGFALLRHKPVLLPENPVLAVLMGTSPHLWFLPFIFLVLVALGLAKSRVSPSIAFLAAALAVLLILATAGTWRPLSLGWPLPLPQWAHAIGAVFAGIAIGLTTRAGKLLVPGVALVAIGLVIAIAAGIPGISFTYGLGIPLTTAAVFLGRRWWPANLSVQAVSECMMGVYLVHIILLSIAGAFVTKGSLLQAVIAFSASLGLVFAARRILPATRLILG